MSLPSLLASPVPAILLKWTALLALGWTAHWLLRRSHARWRLILWRSILCFGLVLPLTRFIHFPGLRISIQGDAPPSTDLPDLIGQFSAGDLPHPIPPEARSPQRQERAGAAASSWQTILMAIWAVGALWAAIRLIRFQMQLSRLREAAKLPAPVLVQLAREIQARFGVLRTVRVRVSDAAASPFVFGLLQPTIILPGRLAHDLTPEEISMVLRHEIAHLCRHDLAWGSGWRWLQAVCWFHPLVWRIPAAHSLACEQEADRLASQQMENPDSYARFLAQMVLRVLALPPVETTLTMNGNSQIALRLDHIRRGGLGPWKWRHSAAGFGLAGVLLLMAAGWEVGVSGSARAALDTIRLGNLNSLTNAAASPIEALRRGGPVEEQVKAFVAATHEKGVALRAAFDGRPEFVLSVYPEKNPLEKLPPNPAGYRMSPISGSASVSGILSQCMGITGTRYLVDGEAACGSVYLYITNTLNGFEFVAAFEGALQTNKPVIYDSAHHNLRRENLVLIRERPGVVKVIPKSRLADYQKAGLIKGDGK